VQKPHVSGKLESFRNALGWLAARTSAFAVKIRRSGRSVPLSCDYVNLKKTHENVQLLHGENTGVQTEPQETGANCTGQCFVDCIY
jgi:hypothetical protein